MPCIGICFAGAMAISHAFFSFRVFISTSVGCFLVALCCFFETDFAAEKPGGSGIDEAFFVFDTGPSLSCTAHLGGGGVVILLLGIG